MTYLTLLESSGLYVGLGIPLVWREGNCFMDDLDTKSRTSLVIDWCGTLVRDSNSNSLQGDETTPYDFVTTLVFGCSSSLWSKITPLKSNSPTSWLVGLACELSPLES